MIWTFGCLDDVLRLETRIDPATAEFVIVSSWASGRSKIERFQDAEQFALRIWALKAECQADDWAEIEGPRDPSDRWRRPIRN